MRRTHRITKALRGKSAQNLVIHRHYSGGCGRINSKSLRMRAALAPSQQTIGKAADATFNVQKPRGLPKKRRIMTKSIGMLLLAIYLILVGITTLFHVGVGAMVMGVVALIAGILILVGK